MSNEIQINVVLNDQTAAQKAKIKADLQAWADGLPPVEVTATNPIDDAWQAEFDAGLKAAAGEPVDVVFGADFEAVQAAAQETFAALRAAAAEPLAIGPANMDEFQASALEAVASVRAEIEAAFSSTSPVYATATRMDQQAGGNGPLALPGGPQATPAGTAPEQPSFQPTFSGGQDPYAAVYQQFQKEPIEIPVRAANPIDDAWLAQVKSSIKSVANDALKIPVNPDLEGFEAQLESVLTELSTTTRADIPVDVGDAMIFREQVADLVQQVEESIHAVIDVQIGNEGALSDLQTKTVAASQATLDLVAAEQKLNEATATGDEEAIAKARADVVTATNAETQASRELEAAMTAAAESEEVADTAAKGAGFSMRALSEAMGPLWMVMNVAQLAMFAFGNTSSSTGNQVQDTTQQIMGLGESAGTATTGLVAGNQNLQNIAGSLTALGSSAGQFAQAYSGSVAQATEYTQRFADQQQKLSGTNIHWDDTSIQKMEQAIGETNTTAVTADHTVGQLTQTVNSNKDAYNALSPAMKAQVDELNHLNDVVPQAKDNLNNVKAAAQQTQQAFAQLGMSLSDNQSAWNSYDLAVGAADKTFQDATSGLKGMFDATDAAAIAAGQAAQAYQQAQAAVTAADEARAAAAHGVITAEEAATQAQESYRNALQQEQQAQEAVATARQQAAQQLINLELQAKDAAAGTLNAGVNLFDAQQAASALGVNAGNAGSVASQAVTAQNEAAVKAAIALIEAQNQLADSQSSQKQQQDALTQAQQQGINGNSQVVSANQALASTSQQVTQAQEAMQNSQFAVQQAQQAAHQAQTAYSDAVANATTTTDGNSLAAARNRDTIEQLYEKNLAVYGPTMAAAQATEEQGKQAGFTAGQVDQVITSLGGLSGKTAFFGIVGQPSVDLSQLINAAQAQGLNPASLGFTSSQIGLADALNQRNPGSGGGGSSYAAGGPAQGGPALVGEQGREIVQQPDGSARLVGQHGPEIVDLMTGSTVMPAANTAGMLPAFASGGVVGANILLGEVGGMFEAARDAYSMFGAQNLPNLPSSNPPPPTIPTGHMAGGVSGSRAQNEAIMQQVFATMFGWTGQQWADAYQLEMMEAGFNNTAQNPTSTAFGMGQFLDGTWASYGIPKTSDPTLQSIAMGRYIESRYGSPAGALAHENAYHWYAAGGPANGWVGINDGGPEAVRLPNGSTVMPAANTAGLMQGPQDIRVQLEIVFGGDTDTMMATAFMRMVRSGQVQLRANGAPVRVG